MTEFTVHDKATAPTESRKLLESSERDFGMVPNLHGVMAESPELLEAYQHLHASFLNTSFSAAEKNVVWLAINVEHDCHYCIPAHTAIAHGMKVPADVIEALRNETPLPDPRLEALRTFTLQVVCQRGQVSAAEVDAFLEAGFNRQQVLEVILGVAQKVMSNYLNHIADTPVDEPFRKFAWRRSDAA